MSDHELSAKRQDAISLAQSFGFTVKRKARSTWEFRRIDSDGHWTVFHLSHQGLNRYAFLTKLTKYEPELSRLVMKAKKEAFGKFLVARRPLLDIEDTPND